MIYIDQNMMKSLKKFSSTSFLIPFVFLFLQSNDSFANRHEFTTNDDRPLQITEDLEIKFGGDLGFIYPNEPYPEFFMGAFEKAEKGTLISVGSGFRALIGAGFGKFDRIILLDVHPDVNEFNRAHIVLVKALGKLPLSVQYQRYQYLAALHCNWLTDSQLSQLNELEAKCPRLSPYSMEFLTTFDSFVPSEKGCSLSMFPELVQPALSLLKSIAVERDVWSPVFFTGHSKVEKSFLGGYYYSHLSKKDYDRKRPAFYWEDDASWSKIQKIAQKGDLLRVIPGNIYGDYAFSSLGSELTQRGEKVSVLDVSNILDYLRGPTDIREDTEEQRSYYQKFITNLKLLPHDQETLVLRTTRGPIAGAQTDLSTFTWTYFWSGMLSLVSKDNPSQKKDWFIHER
jgi:hypothetical protein